MKPFFYLFFMALLIGCNNRSTEASAEKSSTDTTSSTGAGETELSPEQMLIDQSQYFVWEVDADKKTISINPRLQPTYFHVDSLILGLNERYPKIVLEKKRLGHDTLYTEIKNATHLANRMGSLGAEQYIAQAVINLTAVNGVRFVRIDFAEGSHASPGVWSRESFSDYKEVDVVSLEGEVNSTNQ